MYNIYIFIYQRLHDKNIIDISKNYSYEIAFKINNSIPSPEALQNIFLTVKGLNPGVG